MTKQAFDNLQGCIERPNITNEYENENKPTLRNIYIKICNRNMDDEYENHNTAERLRDVNTKKNVAKSMNGKEDEYGSALVEVN